MEPLFYRTCITTELSRRCERNPRYSLRAFARSLGFEPTVISQILSGKRIPSYQTAERLVIALGLNPEDSERFYSSLAHVQKHRVLKRLSPFFRSFSTNLAPNPQRDLNLELFKIIADWYHYAILALTQTKHYQSSPRWIASQLGISQAEAMLAIERMTQLGLLKQIDGQLVAADDGFTTADKTLTNAALKRRQKQILEKSATSLENDPIEQRNHSAMTMAIDPSLIPEAKRRIEAFTQELCQFLEAGQRTKVYEMQISMFPLQRAAQPQESAGQNFDNQGDQP